MFLFKFKNGFKILRYRKIHGNKSMLRTQTCVRWNFCGFDENMGENMENTQDLLLVLVLVLE